MIQPEQLYQAATLVLVVFIVDLLERRRPGFSVHRRSEIGLNVAALLVVIVAGELSKRLVLAGCNALDLDAVLSMDRLRSLPGPAKILLAIVLGDCGLYWVHRAMHTPFLWRTHSFHHSIGEIWWLSGARTSLTHLFLFAVPQIVIIYFLLHLSIAEAGAAFSFGVVVNIWIHANLWVDLGPLEKVLITPNYHRIHHGAKGLTNKNLGFVLTVWDRMFGTYVGPGATGKDFDIFKVPTGKHLVRMLIGV